MIGIGLLGNHSARALGIYLRHWHRRYVDPLCARVPGILTDTESLYLHWLASRVPSSNGAVVVEIGSYLGKSTAYLASALAQKRTPLYALDTWTNDAMSEGKRNTFEEFLRNTQPWRQFIRPLRGFSYDTVVNWTSPIRLLWIDGDHSYEGCSRDLTDWLGFVVPGGLVALHDYTHPCGVRQAVGELLAPREAWHVVVDSIYACALKSGSQQAS